MTMHAEVWTPFNAPPGMLSIDVPEPEYEEEEAEAEPPEMDEPPPLTDEWRPL